MDITKRIRNAVTPFENEKHAREVMAIDETLPAEEQDRLIEELDRKYRPARWQERNR